MTTEKNIGRKNENKNNKGDEKNERMEYINRL